MMQDVLVECIAEYNETVRHNPKNEIVQRKRTLVLLMASFPLTVISEIENHYQRYRHNESAVGVHNIIDETLRPGTNRSKNKASPKGSGDKNIWDNILTVRETSLVVWVRRVIGDFETTAGPKSSTKKQKRTLSETRLG